MKQYFTKMIAVKIDRHILYDNQFIVMIDKCAVEWSTHILSTQLCHILDAHFPI
jgi:hypothetical protein